MLRKSGWKRTAKSPERKGKDLAECAFYPNGCGDYVDWYTWDQVKVVLHDASSVRIVLGIYAYGEREFRHRGLDSRGILFMSHERILAFLDAKKHKRKFAIDSTTEGAVYDPDLSLGDWGIDVVGMENLPRVLKMRLAKAGFVASGLDGSLVQRGEAFEEDYRVLKGKRNEVWWSVALPKSASSERK